MRLALNLGYQTAWSSAADHLVLAKEADRLGYSALWVAEAYGSDTPTMLAWFAGQTERIDLGSAILQIPARTPAMTAMTAATLDTISGGRFRLGLGVSGPQVSEGWHGVRFDKPLGRTREYVEIVRAALRRETLAYQGEHYTLPLPDGPGKALKMIIHPVREKVPVYLAAVGPRNLQLAGEIADGALPLFLSAERAGDYLDPLRAGRAKAGLSLDGFDVAATFPVSIGPDPRACADPVRPYAALYLGGMGSRQQNFYNNIARRMGFEAEARAVQDLYLDRKQREAAAAVPYEFIDRTSLLGPPDRIADRLGELAAAGVTTGNVSPYGATVEDRVESLRVLVGAVERAGLA
jgi:F420-dependent oxidoreductase-like protein